MSKKSPRIAALIARCSNKNYDPHYEGYFHCFNEQLYYEAHDVLEELWLVDRSAPDAAYYKGLIQMAGAFVHLKKNRLHPASRLFHLALKNWDSYRDAHLGLNLEKTRLLCRHYLSLLEKEEFKINPWSEKTAPQLVLN